MMSAATKKRRGQNSRTFVKNLISSQVVGKKLPTKKNPSPHPCHLNKKRDISRHLEALVDLKNGRVVKVPKLEKWTNEKFDQHISGDETFYFCGNPLGDSLVMIDIDCHHSGTLKGAKDFAKSLLDLFPDLHYETSTNGNGVHGYFILEADDAGSEVKNRMLKDLQELLNRRAKAFDIEMVEIKGTFPSVDWSNFLFRSGQLAKLPRDFDAIQKTTVVSVDWLMRATDPLVRERIQEREKSPVRGSRPAKSIRKPSGSFGAKTINEDELQRLGYYRQVACQLLSDHELRTTSRTIVTVEDVAIFLMLLKFFTNNMNEDGTLPAARFQGLWTSLLESGDIDRGFDCHRFKVIRDFFSELGLIEWKDETFLVGRMGVKGRAAKWKASQKLLEILSLEEEREEKDILYRNTYSNHLPNWSNSLNQSSPNECIRPIEVKKLMIPDWNAEEIEQMTGYWKVAA